MVGVFAMISLSRLYSLVMRVRLSSRSLSLVKQEPFILWGEET